MNIQGLIDTLLKTIKKCGYEFSSDEKASIKSTVLDWCSAEQERDNQLVKEKATFEAKCYAYEEIIANSNFAPLIKTQKVGFGAKKEEI